MYHHELSSRASTAVWLIMITFHMSWSHLVRLPHVHVSVVCMSAHPQVCDKWLACCPTAASKLDSAAYTGFKLANLIRLWKCCISSCMPTSVRWSCLSLDIYCDTSLASTSNLNTYEKANKHDGMLSKLSIYFKGLSCRSDCSSTVKCLACLMTVHAPRKGVGVIRAEPIPLECYSKPACIASVAIRPNSHPTDSPCHFWSEHQKGHLDRYMDMARLQGPNEHAARSPHI